MIAGSMQDFRAAMLAALGEAPELIEPGRLHRFSTNGKRGDTSGWCQLFEDGRAGVYGDFRSGMSSVWTAQRRDLMTPTQRAALAHKAAQAKAQRDADKASGWKVAATRLAALWNDSKPVMADGTGTDPVTLYLRHRLALDPGDTLVVPSVLRLHPGLPYHHDGVAVGRWPAMVATLQAPSGELVALHRTWLAPEGRKAPTPGPCKKLTQAAGPVMTGCIRLAWPGHGASDMLGIAEGLETALAARQASGVPTVAAYSAGALAAWQWPTGVKRIVVFADADPPGAEAADKLRQRARTAGLSVNVMTPTTLDADWCDVWAKRGAAGAVEVRA